MEMTKMLLPAVPPSMAQIHGSSDKYGYFSHAKVKNYQKQQRRLFFLKLQQQLDRDRDREREERKNAIYKVVQENCRQLQLQTNLAPNYQSQRVTCPSANEGKFNFNNDIATTANEERSARIQLEPQLQQETEQKSQAVPKLEPELKADSEPEPKQKLNQEVESKPKIDTESLPSWEEGYDEIRGKWNLILIAHSEKKALNEVVEVSDSENDMLISSEIYKLRDVTDSESDLITNDKINPKQSSDFFQKKYKKLRKKRIFMHSKCGNRMLFCKGESIDSPVFQISAPNPTNRSLLRCQQNINNPNYNELPSGKKNTKKQRTLRVLDLTDKTVDPPNFLNEDEVNQELLEYMSEKTSTDESLTSQNENHQPNRRSIRHLKRNEENQRQNDIQRNTLSDHCYHLNEPRNEESETDEHSESEEEIDVETLEQNQRTAETALHLVASISDTPISRRPRGRPPGLNSAKRKRDANQVSGPTPKRARVQNNQRTYRQQNNQQNRSRSDNESDQRRYMHNNMERVRRTNMKGLLDNLKQSIPKIAENLKVSKVSILKHAKNCIREEIELEDQLIEEKARLERLVEEHKNRLQNILKTMTHPSNTSPRVCMH